MSVQLPSHAVHADGSISVQEAAALLGCSEKTIRRRIKAGSLAAHRLPTSQGYEWRVHVDGSPDQSPPEPAVQLDGKHDHVPSQDGYLDTQPTDQLDNPSILHDEPVNEALIKTLDFAERLQRENMELAGRVGFLQAKLQVAEEQILALATGQQESQARETAACEQEPPASRPWWMFWKAS